MDAPLLEYHQQIPENLSPRNVQNYKCNDRHYGNNWNYVRQLGIIENYYQAQGREIPPEL